jgi:hypothetical protein
MKAKWSKYALTRSALAAGIGFVLATTAASAGKLDDEAASPQTAYPKSQADSYQNLFIVGLKDPPLALADTVPGGLESLPRTEGGRLDVHAPAALDYVEHLRQEQDAFLAEARELLGRQIAPLAPEFRFQHAFNGMVVRLSENEAAQLATSPNVVLVEPYTEYKLDTDVGPTLIGAPGIWNGTSTLGLPSRGEGTVLGIIDSGANIGSPSFAATDIDGYTHVNPLGSGNFLGWCNPTNPNHVPGRDVCTDKLIGGWDFTDAVILVPPIANFEGAGFEDENGHGSHTASTAGGNRRNALINGVNTIVSGVAPRANIIAYDVCYTNTAGQGLCPNVSTLGAINQTVADGIVDVINYSISGGGSPWTEANSQAFLAAHNAGIFVAASAGNAGPGPSTLGHLEPWVSTTAATTHNRIFGGQFNLTGPGTPPPNTQNVPVVIGAVPWPTVQTAGPLVVSPGFGNGATDGCTAFPAGTFAPGGTPGLAVLRLDGVTSACASGARRTNAINGGAVGVIFVDIGFLNLGANNTSWGMRLADWSNIEAAIAGDPANAAATISATAGQTNVPADNLAAFSSRGPNPFSLLKPDIAAPGVNILATVSRWNRGVPVPGALIPPPAADGNVGLISGTSMASPHQAGSAALLRSLNRLWTPTQIKTALITTATTTNLVKENGVTPSDPFDRGSGRVDLSRAAKAGLIMDETGANFSAANPATGGNPSQLNLPSFQNLSCVGTCMFPRNVRGTRVQPSTWNAAVNGLPAGAATVTPSSFSTSALNSANFSLGIDSLMLPEGQTVFGELVLTSTNPAIPESRMAIAVRRAPPDITVSPAAISRTIIGTDPITIPVTIANDGNPTLDWVEDTVGLGNIPVLAQPNNAANGFSVGQFLNQAGGAAGIHGADDVNPIDTVELRTIRGEGFMTGAPANPLQVQAQSISFRVYANSPTPPDAPAGSPDAGPAGEVYSCNRTTTGPNSAGLSFLSVDGARFELNTANATGCPPAPTLTAGTKYWVSITPHVNSTSTQRRWAWFRSTLASSGSPWQRISPVVLAIPAWTPPAAPPNDVFAMTITGDAQCGAPWLSMTPDSDSLGIGGQTAATVTIDPTGLSPGTYRAFLCIGTNGTDPDEPKPVVRVDLDLRTEVLLSDGFEDPPIP